jgi:hypothetical protein
MADLKKYTVVSGIVGEAEKGAVIELAPEWGARLEAAGFVQAVPEPVKETKPQTGGPPAK